MTPREGEGPREAIDRHVHEAETLLANAGHRDFPSGEVTARATMAQAHAALALVITLAHTKIGVFNANAL